MYLCCISSTKMISESDFPLNVSCLCQTMSSSCRVNNNLQYIRTFLEHQNKMDIVYNVFLSFRPFLYLWRNTAKFWVVKNKGEFPLSCRVFTTSFRFCCLNVPQNLQQNFKIQCETSGFQHILFLLPVYGNNSCYCSLSRGKAQCDEFLMKRPHLQGSSDVLNVTRKKPQNCLWSNSLRVFFSVKETCF